ncbi:unnamed protein product, partial [Medioppia subpectinata]
VPQLEFSNNNNLKHHYHSHQYQQHIHDEASHQSATNYGNFLSIPVFTFPSKDASRGRHSRSKSPSRGCPPAAPTVCPQITISAAESVERLMDDKYMSSQVEDEGIECEQDFIARESKKSLKDCKRGDSYASFEMHSRPESLGSSRQELRSAVDGHKKLRRNRLISSPTHSLEDFNMEPIRRSGDSLRAPKIRRNPSWPAVMISPNSSSSSEYEASKRDQSWSLSAKKLSSSPVQQHKSSAYLTPKVKKLHKRRLKSSSKRPQLESSLSVNSCPISSDNRLSARVSWFQSSRSSSTESFLSSAPDDDNTIISQIRCRKHHSSQSLCDRSVCDIFNAAANDYDFTGAGGGGSGGVCGGQSAPYLRPKQAIASISDTALDKRVNDPINCFEKQSSKPVSNSLDASSASRKRSKRTIHKQKAMQEDDHIFDSFLDKQLLLERI